MRNAKTFLIVVLAVCNIALLITLNQFSAKGRPVIDQGSDGEGLQLIKGTPGSAPFILYLFFHADGNCGCLEDWPNWVDLSNEYPTILQVMGIFNGQSEVKFLGFGDGMGLPFPLYRDPSGSFRHEMRVLPNTVTKILVGPSDEILLADAQQISQKVQRDFKKRVREHLDKFKEAPSLSP